MYPAKNSKVDTVAHLHFLIFLMGTSSHHSTWPKSTILSPSSRRLDRECISCCRLVGFTCQKQWWFVSTVPSLSPSSLPSSLPPSPSVCCCHCKGQRQTAAYHSLCREGNWLQSAITPESVHSRTVKCAEKISADPSYTSYELFQSLFYGRREVPAVKSGTTKASSKLKRDIM